MFKGKIWIFVFGLLAGVVLGVVFDVGIKTIIKQVRELHLSINRLTNTQDKLSQKIDSLQGKLKDNKIATVVKSQPKVISPVQPIAPKHDSVVKNSAASNDGDDDASATDENKDSNIVVMTNQLVSVKTLPLNSVDSLSRAGKVNHKSDSMIAAMSNVEDELDPRYYRIEFWQSPLNFKGYKMSKGKIILYGINSNSDMRLVKWDDEYYLMTDQVVYKVEYTDDYRPFEKVMDKTLLKKITL